MDNNTQFKINKCIRILEQEKEECCNPEVKNALRSCIRDIKELDELKTIQLKEGCPSCDFLVTLGEVQSNREYWIITEIYVHLHGGKDYCTYKKDKKCG